MEKYNRAEPDAGDELAKAAPPPSPFGGGGGGAPFAGPMANESAAEGRAAIFQAAAANRLAPAVQAAVEPMLRRLAQIEAMEDETAQRAALTNFRAALPELYSQAIAKVPAAAAVLEQIIGTAFVSGLAEHAQTTRSAVSNA